MNEIKEKVLFPLNTTCTLCWSQCEREEEDDTFSYRCTNKKCHRNKNKLFGSPQHCEYHYEGNKLVPDYEKIGSGIDTCGGKKNKYWFRNNVVKKAIFNKKTYEG